jgi:hypothetical protein
MKWILMFWEKAPLGATCRWNFRNEGQMIMGKKESNRFLRCEEGPIVNGIQLHDSEHLVHDWDMVEVERLLEGNDEIWVAMM